MRGIVCNDDLRQRAQRRLPKAIFDYVDRGSYSELTLAANRRAFDRVSLVQRVMRDVSEVRINAEMLDERVAMPVALGPTGLTGLVYPEGEILACRAAHAMGIPYCLSTASICSIEDVRARVDAPFWFQLYIMRDRGFVRSLVERASEAGCPVLIVTVDLAAQGQRHQDHKNGLSVPPRLTLRNAFDMLSHPRWLAGMLRTPHKSFGNFKDYAGIGTDIGAITRWINTQFDASLTWKDIDWLRSQWKGKLVVKGILSAEDAELAYKHGADAVVVSNHGGRQLDGAKSSLAALGPVVDAIGGVCEVYLDGGVRSGQDVARALALGANGAWLGRAFLYGLASYGQVGVEHAIGLIAAELTTTLKLMGLADVAELDRAAIELG